MNACSRELIENWLALLSKVSWFDVRCESHSCFCLKIANNFKKIRGAACFIYHLIRGSNVPNTYRYNNPLMVHWCAKRAKPYDTCILVDTSTFAASYIYAYQQIMVVILPFVELQMGCTNAEENVDGLMFMCCGLLSTVKTICFRIYADNLTDTYNAAVDDYQTIENPGQRKIMRRFAFIGRMLACSMVCFAYFACAVYTLIPLLGDEPINQLNVTDEDTVLQYTIPSRCTMEYFHAPMSMYKAITLSESFIMALTCTCNHGNICVLISACNFRDSFRRTILRGLIENFLAWPC